MTKEVKEIKTYYINPESLVTLKEVAEILGMHYSTVTRMSAYGNFPKSFRVAKKKKYFRYKDILGFIDDKQNGIEREYEKSDGSRIVERWARPRKNTDE